MASEVHQCCICLESPPIVPARANDGHVYCESCIFKWLERNTRSPYRAGVITRVLRQQSWFSTTPPSVLTERIASALQHAHQVMQPAWPRDEQHSTLLAHAAESVLTSFPGALLRHEVQGMPFVPVLEWQPPVTPSNDVELPRGGAHASSSAETLVDELWLPHHQPHPYDILPKQPAAFILFTRGLQARDVDEFVHLWQGGRPLKYQLMGILVIGEKEKPPHINCLSIDLARGGGWKLVQMNSDDQSCSQVRSLDLLQLADNTIMYDALDFGSVFVYQSIAAPHSSIEALQLLPLTLASVVADDHNILL